MFVFLRDVSAAKQVIATLLATALILWASGAFNIGYAQAANITDAYVLLDDSAPSASSTQVIEFLAPSGVGAGATITISYPAGFDLGSLIEDDIDLEIDGVDEPTAAAPAGATWGVTIVGQDIIISSGSATIGGTASITVKVGANADGSGAGSNEITNPPSPTNGNESYEISISAGADSGNARVVILDTVLVTAQVATQFDFTVTGLAANADVSGGATSTLLSTSTTIPFGELTAFEREIIAQQLNVSTNAANGYVVTVQKDGAFESSTGADIDDFIDSVLDDDTPAAWQQPANTLNNENTYGHWGITTDDTDTNGNRTTEFGAGQYVGIGLQAAPTVIMAHNGPVAGQVTGQGSTTVGYSVEISPLQEAGDDYEAILTYIATPTF